jgi:hypothetical protein
VLALFSDRLELKRKDCAALAGKSTINRLEHAPRDGGDRYHKIGHDAQALERVFADIFLDAHGTPPEEIVLDLDATDDPLHGHQEGRFFHGYYDCYCYLPLYVFCGRQLLAAKLRRANIDAAAGAKDEVARLVAHIRRRWPKVRILLRADSGFAREELMAWCEEHRVDYVFGLARNSRLVDEIAIDLARAEAEHQETGKPARRFKDFSYTTRDSWSRSRRVIGKAEHLGKGANPRFIVTSIERSAIDAQTLYEQITAPAARWRTASRSASSICSPIVPRRRPWPPTSCVCGSRRSPMCCCRRCAGSPFGHRTRAGHLRQHPLEAPQTRRPGDSLGQAHQNRHRLGLPVPGRIRPRPCPAARAAR